MSGPPEPDTDEASQTLTLGIFRERHGHDLSLRDDVFRTLPFFATALGVVIATVGAATSRLPSLDIIGQSRLLTAAAITLTLALVEAVFVLVMLGRVTAPVRYAELATEEQVLALRRTAPGSVPVSAATLREELILNYAAIAPANRAKNQRSSKGRALAAVNLIASLMLTLIATGLILVADKLALLPKVTP